MKSLRFRLAPIAAVSLAGFMAGSASAAPLTFDVDAVQEQGGGCHFRDTAQGPADAFLIANGNEITAIFTQLGSDFRGDRRTGELQSACRYRIPGTLESGYFISGIEQVISYGLVKTAGVGVNIQGTTNYARRLPNGKSHPADVMKNLASAEAVFSPADILNIPLQTLTPLPVRVRRGQSGDNAFNRFCGRERPRGIDSLAGLGIRLSKQSPDAQVSVSIDGLDVRYAVGVTLESCR